LYGFDRDKGAHSLPLEKKEELDLVVAYCQQRNLTFPIAVSFEGYPFEEYSISQLPTTVFIDHRGKVGDVVMGMAAYSINTFSQKIKKLLEEK